MYVARVGPVVSVLQTAGLTLSFPEDLTDDEPLFSVPLGLLPEPEISMVRYGVNAGSRLLLSDGNLADIPVDRLTSVLLENDIEKVLHSLRRTIKIQSQLMLVELVPPEYEGAVLAAPGESSREISMKLGAARQELDVDGEQWKLPRRGDFGSLISWGLARVAGRIAGGLLFFSDLFQRFFPLAGGDADAAPVFRHADPDRLAHSFSHREHRDLVLGIQPGRDGIRAMPGQAAGAVPAWRARSTRATDAA